MTPYGRKVAGTLTWVARAILCFLVAALLTIGLLTLAAAATALFFLVMLSF